MESNTSSHLPNTEQMFRSLQEYDKELINETWRKLNIPLNYWSTQSVFTKMTTIGEIGEHVATFRDLYPPLAPLTNDDKYINLSEEEAVEWACKEIQSGPSICVNFTMRHKKAPLASFRPILPDTTPVTLPKLLHPPKLPKDGEDPMETVRQFLSDSGTVMQHQKPIKSKAFYAALLKCMKETDLNTLIDPSLVGWEHVLYSLNTPNKVLDMMDRSTDFWLIDSRRSLTAFLKTVDNFLHKYESEVPFGNHDTDLECGSVILQTLGHECDILLVSVDGVDYAIDCLELDADLAVSSAMPKSVMQRLLSSPNVLKVVCGTVRASYDIKKRLRMSSCHIAPVFYPITALAQSCRISDLMMSLYNVDTSFGSGNRKTAERESFLRLEPLNISLPVRPAPKSSELSSSSSSSTTTTTTASTASTTLWNSSSSTPRNPSIVVNNVTKQDGSSDASVLHTPSAQGLNPVTPARMPNKNQADEQPTVERGELGAKLVEMQHISEDNAHDDLLTLNYKADAAWSNRPINLVSLHKTRKSLFLLMSEAWRDAWALCQAAQNKVVHKKTLGGLSNSLPITGGISAFSSKLSKSESSAFSLHVSSPKAVGRQSAATPSSFSFSSIPTGFAKPPLPIQPIGKCQRSSSTTFTDQKTGFMQRLGINNHGLNAYFVESKEISLECNVPTECVMSDRLLLFCKQNNIDFPPPLEVVVAIEGKNRVFPPFLLAKIASLSNSMPSGSLPSQFSSLDELYKFMGWGKYHKSSQQGATNPDQFTSVCKDEMNISYGVSGSDRASRSGNQSRSLFNQSPYRFSPINLLPSAKFGLRPSSRERGQCQYNFVFDSPIPVTPIAHKNSPPSPVRSEDEIYPQTPTAIQQAAELSRASKKKSK